MRANDQQLRVVRVPYPLLSPFSPPSPSNYAPCRLPVLYLLLPLPHRLLKKQLRRLTSKQELSSISDQEIYTELQASDLSMGRWTAEDPSLRSVLRWIAARQ